MFAEQDSTITAYSFDAVTKEYISSFEYFWAVGTGLAANSTQLDPLEHKQGFTIIYDEESATWSYIEDHRGTKVFSTSTQQESEIDYIGPIKDGFTLLKPVSSFETWTGETWADQRTAEEIAAYNRSLFQKLSKRQFALYLYDHDMYDQVMQAIEANPRFKIEYDSVSDIERLSPTVSAMTTLLNWTEEQVDQMWTEALTL